MTEVATQPVPTGAHAGKADSEGLVIEGLTVRYGGHLAVDDVSLTHRWAGSRA